MLISYMYVCTCEYAYRGDGRKPTLWNCGRYLVPDWPRWPSRDMGDVSTYRKIIRNLLGLMKPPGSNLCADTRRYKYLRASQGVKTERDLHCVERGLLF